MGVKTVAGAVLTGFTCTVLVLAWCLKKIVNEVIRCMYCFAVAAFADGLTAVVIVVQLCDLDLVLIASGDNLLGFLMMTEVRRCVSHPHEIRDHIVF